MAGEGQDVMYRLVEDVGGLKRQADNVSETLRELWKRADQTQAMLADIGRKIDHVAAQETRLQDVELGVSSYRSTKARAIALITGIGAGTGLVSASVIDAVKNWWHGG